MMKKDERNKKGHQKNLISANKFLTLNQYLLYVRKWFIHFWPALLRSKINIKRLLVFFTPILRNDFQDHRSLS